MKICLWELQIKTKQQIADFKNSIHSRLSGENHRNRNLRKKKVGDSGNKQLRNHMQVFGEQKR